MSGFARIPRGIGRLWRTDAPLTGTAAAMLVVLIGTVAGLALDSRIIAGAPAWLKPAKFAASIAIYTATLAWIFTCLPDWPRLRRVVSRVTVVTLNLEIVIIALQAWRGTTSHFNVATPLDVALWSTMGTAIAVQTIVSVAVAVALWRQRFDDRALGWALRLGLTITIAGASTGGLMTGPTKQQIADARVIGRMTVSGAHTVGAPDGQPGLPVTGWSREHGDLRIPHFVGLHAVQILPILTLLFGRRYSHPQRVRFVVAASASYAALFAMLLAQALRGQALFQPDPVTLALLGVWTLATVAAVGGQRFTKCQRRPRSAGPGAWPAAAACQNRKQEDGRDSC